MSARRYRSTFSGLALAVTFIVAGCGLAFAQDGINESTIPPSSPPSRIVRPSPAQLNLISPLTNRRQSPQSSRKHNPVHGSRRRYCRRNRIDVRGSRPKNSRTPTACISTTSCRSTRCSRFRIPSPPRSPNLKNQVETLSAQQQAAEQKSDAAADQIKTLQGQVQELTGENQDLQSSVRYCHGGSATAISLGIAARSLCSERCC